MARLFIIHCLLSAAALARTWAVDYATPPFLQNLKKDSIAVMWECDSLRTAGVDYGLTNGYGDFLEAEVRNSGAGTFIYKCRLTGLQPGREYRFRVRFGEETGMDRGFKTGPDRAEPFSFGVWADSQGTNHGSYPADLLEPTKRMMAHLAARKPDFGVGVGDLAENGASYTDTRSFYLDRVARYLGQIVPYFIAWGNHDGQRGDVLRLFADQPSRERPGYTPGYGSFSFDYAGCHFVCVDYLTSFEDILNWLESDLESDASRNAKFTFLFIHVPPFCELWIDGDPFLRAVLVPMMEEYGVDVCFSGHTHEYSRGYLNGVYYCVTGGGSWLDTPERIVADWPHMTVGGNHPVAGIPQIEGAAGGGLVNEYVHLSVEEDRFTATMIGFHPSGEPIGVLDTFSKSLIPTAPPDKPRIDGPARFNYFDEPRIRLSSSAFSAPEEDVQHGQSLWRISVTTEPETRVDTLVEYASGADLTSVQLDARALIPGRAYYASVRHVSSDQQSSPYSDPLEIHPRPEPIYREDFEEAEAYGMPEGWTSEHYTAVDLNVWDPLVPASNTYLSWTVVPFEILSSVFGETRVNQSFALYGQSVYAESDRRSPSGQIQYMMTPDFDISGRAYLVLAFRSNYVQNQDSLAGLEYSLDAGASWNPLMYLLDEPDVVRDPITGEVDADATMTRVDPHGVPGFHLSSPTDGTYGEHLLVRPFERMAPYIQARLNDDFLESKRVEWLSLPPLTADRIRFRFTHVGTASWFWGVDDFSLFSLQHPLNRLRFVSIVREENRIVLKWAGGRPPYILQGNRDLNDENWENVVRPLGVTQYALEEADAAPWKYFRIYHR